MADRRSTQRLRRVDARAAPCFATVLGVLLVRNSDFVTGHDMRATLCALQSTNHATRHTITVWVREQLVRDTTRGHEPRAIGVDSTTINNTQPTLRQLLLLLQFRYATSVRIPTPRARHELPRELRERLRRENDEVARVVRGCHAQLYAAYSESTGWGIHAVHAIAQGEYVGEYTGELVSSAEATRRHRSEYDRTGMNYVLALREQTRDAGSVVRTNVDATRCGSYARFFNHSCEPTLRVEALRVDSFVPRLVFFTQRELEPDEQLTLDYGCGATPTASVDGATSSIDGETDATASAARRVACQCHAPSCRGTMPYDASL